MCLETAGGSEVSELFWPLQQAGSAIIPEEMKQWIWWLASPFWSEFAIRKGNEAEDENTLDLI